MHAKDRCSLRLMPSKDPRSWCATSGYDVTLVMVQLLQLLQMLQTCAAVLPSMQNMPSVYCSDTNDTQVVWSVEDSLVSGNTAAGGHGGGLLLALGFTCFSDPYTWDWFRRQPEACVSVRNSHFEGNVAAGGGGALAVHNPHLVVSTNVGQRTAPARVLVLNSTFLSNRAGRDSSTDVVQTTVRTPQAGMGGALYLHVPPAWRAKTHGWWTENCVLTVGEGSVFRGNSASDMGGAVALVWCAARLGGGVRVEGNSAGSSGGGVALLQDTANVGAQPETQLGAWDIDLPVLIGISGGRVITVLDGWICGPDTARGTHVLGKQVNSFIL